MDPDPSKDHRHKFFIVELHLSIEHGYVLIVELIFYFLIDVSWVYKK